MSNTKVNILIVEDDNQIRNFISFTLKQEAFSYLAVANANDAFSHLLTNQIDLVLLDLGSPDIDGMDVIRRIREWSEMPIIVVSARDQDKEKAAALDAGADDYLTKPFSSTELMARIRVAIRHIEKTKINKENPIIEICKLKIDISKRLVYLEDKVIHVTPMEYSLLVLLFRNIGKVLTTQMILKELYGKNYGSDTQALRALMAGLRRKIEQNPAKPRYIITEIGVGYRLVDQ